MSVRISELDFDQIKSNLKDFLRSQDEFNSYDFEASGLNVLIELLAYNTHYDAYMANQIHNEAFLDSAIKRESVVSKAKHLSYTPRSARSATAIVDITVNSPAGSPNFLTLDRYTPFYTSIDGRSYSFVNVNAITIQPVSGIYTFTDVELKEGMPYSYSFNVVSPGPAEKYTIPNDNVDTSTIRVTVQNSSTDTTTTVYSLVEDITTVNNTSNVYYLEENISGKYDIYFGDGVLGKQLAAGNIVRIEYLITNTTLANVSSNFNQTFVLSGSIQGNTNVSINVSQNSTGGAAKETIEEIKFNAPRNYIAQSRAVTPDDYSVSIQSNVGNIESVAIWGGEDNDPPIYGKVFVSLKPFSGYEISNSTKDSIKRNILKARNVVSVIPEFVDPDYVWLTLEAQIRYRPSMTTKSSSQIIDLARIAVQNYFATDLQKFNSDFVLSRASAAIDAADPSIYGSQLVVKTQKRIEPLLNALQTFTLNFLTRIHPAEIETTRFYVYHNNVLTPARIIDSPDEMPPNYDGTGTLRLINADSGDILINNIGSVNYPTGIVTISNLEIAGFYDDQPDIRITASVQEFSSDINVSRNNILVLDNSTLNKLVNRNAGLTINTIAETK